MLQKIKSFFKWEGLASLYLVLFLVVQMVVMAIAMVWFVFNDPSFQDLFMQTLSPIYDAEGYSIWNSYPDLLVAFATLFGEILVPSLLISNTIVVLIVGGKLLASKTRSQHIQKLPASRIAVVLGWGAMLNAFISDIIKLLPATLVDGHDNTISAVVEGNPILLLVSSGILAPLAEELIFRYGMQKNMCRFNVAFGIIGQALLFGVMHGNPVQIVYASVLGLLFGYIVWKTHNLLYSILLHVGINASSVLAACFFPELGVSLFALACYAVYGILMIAKRVAKHPISDV